MSFKVPPSFTQWPKAIRGSNKVLTSQQKLEYDLSRLNQTQQVAVKYAGPHPLMILAAPGSGKTATLTMRIAYLVNEMRIPPSSILAITFTRKAGDEMKNRIQRLLPVHISPIYTSTFHQFCFAIIRNYFNDCGFSNSPKIVDGKTQRLILSIILKELRSTMSRNDVPDFSSVGHKIITEVKKIRSKDLSGNDSDSIDQLENETDDDDVYPVNNAGISEKKCFNFVRKAKRMKWQPSEFDPQMSFILEAYNAALKSGQMMDLDDFIPITVNLFNSNPHILAQSQRQWTHILVDEFQDVSLNQLDLIMLLRGENGNLTVCGDEDQSIFGFRSGSSQTFKLLKSRLPNVTSIVLNKTYRSTPQIIQVADSLIRYNTKRTEKELSTIKANGSSVKIRSCYDAQAEARDVCSQILHYCNDQHLKLSEIAVLCRVRSVLNQFSEHFRQAGVPFEYVQDSRTQLNKGKKLPKLTRRILAYCELISLKDHSSDQFHLSFFEVMKDTKGIGKKTIENIQEALNHDDVKNVLKVTSKFALSCRPGVKQKLLDLVNFVKSFQAQTELLSVEKCIETINSLPNFSIAHTDVEIESLIKAAKESDQVKSNLKDFCHQFRINQSFQTKEVEQLGQKDRVALSTIHQAKGREWECVFVVRFNDGTLPLDRNADSGEQKGFGVTDNAAIEHFEEERRISYVALTRAKSHLFLSYIGFDHKGDNVLPSRFLGELPKSIERWQPQGEHKMLHQSIEPSHQTRLFDGANIKPGGISSSQWRTKCASGFQSASALLEKRPCIPNQLSTKFVSKETFSTATETNCLNSQPAAESSKATRSSSTFRLRTSGNSPLNSSFMHSQKKEGSVIVNVPLDQAGSDCSSAMLRMDSHCNSHKDHRSDSIHFEHSLQPGQDSKTFSNDPLEGYKSCVPELIDAPAVRIKHWKANPENVLASDTKIRQVRSPQKGLQVKKSRLLGQSSSFLSFTKPKMHSM